MSGGIAPSKSTVYVGNLPFSLTNNDIHKVLDRFGKIVKVTITRDRVTHKSKGIAFVLFLSREDAHKCVESLNQTEVFGRTLTCSIAKDNGRTTEFITRKTYPDKSTCYECGEVGHMSYNCSKNLLGDRERPIKKKREKKKNDKNKDMEYETDDSNIGEDPSLDSLANAISEQQKLHDSESSKFVKIHD